MSTDLVIVLPNDPAVVYEGIDKTLAEITALARTAPKDATSDENRKAIISMAYKVARTKTALDGLGKKLIEDAQARVKMVNAQRKLVSDTLDALKAEVRKPVDEFEAMEERRVADHNSALQDAWRCERDAREIGPNIESPDEFFDRLEKRVHELNAREWQEFKGSAQEVIRSAFDSIATARARRKQADADAAELKRLREEAAERQRIDREREIAQRAAKEERDWQEADKRRLEEESQRRLAEQKAAEVRAQMEAQREAAARAAAEQRAHEIEVRAREEQDKAEQQAKQFAEDKRIAEAKVAEAQEQLAREAEQRRQREETNRQLQVKLEASMREHAATKIELLTATPSHIADVARRLMGYVVKGAGHEADTAMAIARGIAKGEVPHVRYLTLVGVPANPEPARAGGDDPERGGPGTHTLRGGPAG